MRLRYRKLGLAAMLLQRGLLYETKDDFTNKRTTTAEITRPYVNVKTPKPHRLNNL